MVRNNQWMQFLLLQNFLMSLKAAHMTKSLIVMTLASTIQKTLARKELMAERKRKVELQ